MKSSRIGVCCALLAIAVAPLGCESSSSSSGGVDKPDTGTFDPDAGGDGGNVDPPVKSECVPPTKGPTMHGGGSTSDPDSDVWTADASPHILPYDTTIYHTVTLEPCAEVLIADGHTVTVRGKLIAEGSATKRIHIGGKDAGKPFASILVQGGSMRFAYATIDGGGAPLNAATYNASMIDLQGDNLMSTQEVLFVDHVTIAGSGSNGLMLREGAGFVSGSNALVIKGSAAYPLSIGPRMVNNIPAGSYTGNKKDSILLPTSANSDTFSETATLHDRGVPYLVGEAPSAGDLRVERTNTSMPDPTLTIEPGVVMRFKKGGLFQISVFSSTNPAHSSLVAVGTAAKPIVFTSDEATPAAGDWVGLRWGNIPTAINKLDHVRVEYAGATTSTGSGSCPYPTGTNDAAIRINGWPGSQFITNTEVVSSANHGIDRGWRADDPVIEFLPTNKFTNVPRCHQTYPPTAGNVCPPDPVPCPM